MEVARRVGVSRGPVYYWTRRSEKFIAALESWRRDMEGAARARLLGLGHGFIAHGRTLYRSGVIHIIHIVDGPLPKSLSYAPIRDWEEPYGPR